MLTFQSVLLDLDGTLVDSAPGIVSTIAFTLKEMGREVPTMAELLRWVGLGERLHKRPETLSGGEQQRVAIARAVVTQPNLLIADEPTGNVDPDMAARLMRLFYELNKRLGTTVVIATHDLGLIRQIDAPVYRLADGMLVQENGEGAPTARRRTDPLRAMR